MVLKVFKILNRVGAINLYSNSEVSSPNSATCWHSTLTSAHTVDHLVLGAIYFIF